MRPSRQETYLLVAKVLAERSTCARRKTGCVLTDRNGEILSTGYNGVPPGVKHCIDKPCLGANHPSGTGLDLCEALHAEQNALIRCRRPEQALKIYCTASPCMHCTKMLANTGIKEIYFLEPYPDHEECKIYWLNSHPFFDRYWTWAKYAPI